MEKNTNCSINIDELLKIETILLNLSNKMIDAELKGNKEEFNKLKNYYELSLFVEQKTFAELNLNHNTFLELIKYLKEKNGIQNNRLESLIYEEPHLVSLRIINKLMSMIMNFDNIHEENLMKTPNEQKEILNSLFGYESKEMFSDKELYSMILSEQQLARTYLYNLEDYIKDNKELTSLKHNLSYVYGYQTYDNKMAIIEKNNDLEKFFKTDVLTYNKANKKYLNLLANVALKNNMKNIILKEKKMDKNSILLKSVIYMIDDMSVNELRDIAIDNGDEYSLNIIEKARIEKYDINLENFKRR